MNIIEYIVSSYDLEKTLTIVNFCCPSKIEKNNSYLNYIISKNKSIKSLLEESFRNEKYNKLFLKRGSISVMFPKYIGFNTHSHITNLFFDDIYHQTNLYYNTDEIKLDDNLKINNNLNDKKIGIYRLYIGRNENRFDLVSGLYKNEIKKNTINEEKYSNFLMNIQKRKMFINVIQKPEIKNYEDIKNLDYFNKIDSLVTKLSHYLNKNLKSLKDKLNNLGLIQKSDDDLVNRIEFKDEMNLYSFRIQNIKSYINDYFRKYINVIKNKYEIKHIPDLDMEKEEKEEFQKTLIEEYSYFKEFFEYHFIFKELKDFDYSFDEINNMNGDKDTYSSNWTRKMKSAKYNYRSVSDMLMYILITQLDMLLYEKETIEYNNRSISSETINVLLSQFIMKVFDKIEYDFSKVNVDDNEYKKYRQGLVYQNSKRDYRIVSDSKMEFLTEVYQEDDKDALIDKIKEHKEQVFEKYKEASDLVKNTLVDTSSQKFDDLVEDTIHEEQIDDNEREEYDISRPGDIDEIMDGDDYGEEDNSMETAGDGITQAEFDEQEQQYEDQEFI